MENFKRLGDTAVEANDHSKKTVLSVARTKVEQLDKLLGDGERGCDATRWAEGGTRPAAMGKDVTFEEVLEKSSYDTDGWICLLHSVLARVMSSLKVWN